MTKLHPCQACARHVRASERVCPFCATALPDGPTPIASPPRTSGRLGRAALLALGTSVASVASVAALGCEKTTATKNQDPVVMPDAPDAAGVFTATAYGAAPPMDPIDAAAPTPPPAKDAGHPGSR